MMISPSIHRLLRRDDLARLVALIALTDPEKAEAAALALESGKVDSLLDAPEALDAVRGSGGAPAPLPLTLLWYIPVRAALRDRGEHDVELADYTATIPLAFLQSRTLRAVARGETGLSAWWGAIRALPNGTIAKAECAAYCGALAIWWSGCFPEWVTRGGNGSPMLGAYVTFARSAFSLAARLVGRSAPQVAAIHEHAADRAEVLREALTEARADYLGRDAHTAEGRIERYLSRLQAASS